MEIKLIEVFDDSEALSKLDKIANTLSRMDDEAKGLGLTLNDALKKGAVNATDFQDEINSLSDSLGSSVAQSNRMANSQLKVSDAAKAMALNMRVAGRSIQEWKDYLSGINQALDGSVAASGRAGSGMAKFGLVLKGLGIGLIIAALVAVISYLNKFEAITKKVEQVTSGLGAVVNELSKRFTAFGGIVTNAAKAAFAFITLDIKGFFKATTAAVESSKEAFSGLGDAMSKAYSEGVKFAQFEQDLKDSIQNRIVVNAELEKSVSRLRLIQEDETKGYARRIAAAKEAASIELQLSNQRVTIAKRNESLSLQGLALGKRSKEELIESEVEVINAEKESYETRARNTKAINILVKAAATERRKALEADQKALEDLNKALDAFRKKSQGIKDDAFLSNQGDEVGNLTAKYQIELRKIQEQRAELEKEAKAIGIDFDLGPAFEILIQALRLEYEKAVKEAVGDPVEVLGSTIKIPARVEPEIEINDFEQFKAELLKKLRITEGEAAQLFTGVTEVYRSVMDGIAEITDAYIFNQERIINAIDERIDKQKELVDKEKSLYEQGLDNSLSVEKAKLNALQAEREKAEEKRLALQRKAARQQLIADSLSQASSMATGAANILASESSKGLAGVIIALGAIAFMFKIFATAKANAVKNAAPDKLREGKRITGKSHYEGGEKYVGLDGRSYEVENQEWVIGTRHSKEHDSFLSRLNKGAYKGRNLVAELQATNGLNIADSAKARNEAVSDDALFVSQAIQQGSLSFEKGADRIIKSIESKPVIAPDGKYVEIFYKKGTKTKRQNN